MPRSEYYEPALLPGEKEQPQIIIDAVELYDLLYILMRVNYAYPQEHARLKSPRSDGMAS